MVDLAWNIFIVMLGDDQHGRSDSKVFLQL